MFYNMRNTYVLIEVTLKDIMAQLQRMDARLDTLNDELYQVNTRVGRIA